MPNIIVTFKEFVDSSKIDLSRSNGSFGEASKIAMKKLNNESLDDIERCYSKMDISIKYVSKKNWDVLFKHDNILRQKSKRNIMCKDSLLQNKKLRNTENL